MKDLNDDEQKEMLKKIDSLKNIVEAEEKQKL